MDNVPYSCVQLPSQSTVDTSNDEEDSDLERQNTNVSANMVELSSTSLTPAVAYSSYLPLPAPIGYYSRPIPPPTLLPPQLGPFVTPVAPVPYMQLPMPTGAMPATPAPGFHLSVPPGMMNYCQPNAVGSGAPPPSFSYSTTSSTYIGQSHQCLPVFFPSETSFQLSTSPCPSDANLTASQVTLGGCPSLVFNQPCPPGSLASSSSAGPSPVVYPIVYVSPAGLLTVLMRDDIAVEMTLDRAIRVVNHAHKSVAATNGRGNASCIHHAAAKIYQDRTTTQLELYDERRAKMTTDDMLFAIGSTPTGSSAVQPPEPAPPPASCYRLTQYGLKANTNPDFADLSQDMSVTLLFSSSGYGPHLIAQYEEVAQASRYRFYRNGAVTVYINGVRIHQVARGDVIVASGRKYLRVSPKSGLARIVTHFVEMTVEQNWTVRVRRGGHRLLANSNVFLLANDKFEFGFDQLRRPFLQPLSERQETIICRLEGGGHVKGYLEPQSSDSRLLSQCMVAPSYSDWPLNSDYSRSSSSGQLVTSNSVKLWSSNIVHSRGSLAAPSSDMLMTSLTESDTFLTPSFVDLSQ